jgi:hypothetical protein
LGLGLELGEALREALRPFDGVVEELMASVPAQLSDD